MRFTIVFYSIVACSLSIFFIVMTRSSLVPYNIRELLDVGHPIFTSIMLTCLLISAFGFPVWIAEWFQKSAHGWILLPLILIFHSAVSWAILRVSVPMESIHDILGAPILSWPKELEYIVRFIPLFIFVMIFITFSALSNLIIQKTAPKVVMRNYLAPMAILAAIGHWVVIEKAATDNLTELMTSGGTVFSSFLIAIAITIISFTASQLSLLAVRVGRKRILLSIVLFIVSFPLSFISIYGATEKNIVKYGEKFSALQFLLSSGRDHYAGFSELLIRFSVAHTGCILMIALMQVPIWRWINREKIKTT